MGGWVWGVGGELGGVGGEVGDLKTNWEFPSKFQYPVSFFFWSGCFARRVIPLPMKNFIFICNLHVQI